MLDKLNLMKLDYRRFIKNNSNFMILQKIDTLSRNLHLNYSFSSVYLFFLLSSQLTEMKTITAIAV
jgi:hypothetical protein